MTVRPAFAVVSYTSRAGAFGFSGDEVQRQTQVLSGGELPAMVLMDAIVRQVPGVLGDAESAVQESFVKGFMPYVPPGSLIVFSPGLAGACLGFSVALGLVAGVYPALRASAISPIEAIRG